VHEYLELSGRIVNSEIGIHHMKKGGSSNSDRNLRIYERILSAGGTLSARGRYYYSRELKDNGRYADAARSFESFLDSGRGWQEDNIAACGELAKCLLMLGESEKALLAMLRSFAYDLPRAERCCQIGYYFKDRGDYRRV
jgi:tetratricopeptide (TPR) repeat protein